MSTINDRTPPQDIDAEQALLGLCMERGRIPEAAEDIRGSDFYRPNHEQIWDCLTSLVKAGKNCDPMSVNAWLTERQLSAKLGGAVYLHDLLEAARPVATAGAAVEIILDRSLRRHIISAHTTGLQMAYESSDEAEAILQRSESLLAKVPARDSGNVDSLVTLDEFLGEHVPEPQWVVPGLLARGERLILTGVEGGGKSTLVRQLALCAAAGIQPFSGKPVEPQTVLMVDVENPMYIMQTRLGELRRAINAHGGSIEPTRLWIDRRPEGMNLGDPADRRWLQRRVKVTNPDLIVIGPAYKLHEAGNDDKDETIARTVTSVLDDLRGDAALVLEHHAGNEQGGHIRPIRPFGSSLWRRWPEFGYGIRPIRVPKGMSEEEAERRRLVDLVGWRGPRDERAWPRQMESGGDGLPWVETVVDFGAAA